NNTNSAGLDQAKCQTAPSGPTSFTLAGTASGGTSAWSQVGQTGTAQATIATPSSLTSTVSVAGIGTVTLRLSTTSNCGNPTDDVVLTVNANPTAAAGPDEAKCQTAPSGPTSFTLAGSASNGTSAWSQVGQTGTAQATIATPSSLTSTVSVAGFGTVTLRLTTTSNATPSCGNSTDDVVLTVNPNPILVITSPPSVCSPLTVDLTAASVTAGSTLYGATLTYWTNASATIQLANPNAVSISGTYYIKATTTESCYDIESVSVLIESCAKALCTYTQGYYGNLGGMSCAPDDGGVFSNKYTTLALIERALSSYSGGVMTIGSSGNTVVITNTPADRMAIIDVLPGGGGSYVLSGVNYINSLPSSYLTKKGTLNNTLLAQTITLGLNLGINGALGDFALQGGKIATAAPEGGCGSDIPKARSCNSDGTVNNEYQRYDIPAKVVNALTDKTVQGLFDLANTALGGGSTNGLSLSDIAGAVDAINNAFDGCRIFMGYDVPLLECPITLAPTQTTSKMELAGFDAYPVPFKDVLTIKYNFDYVSDVKIEVVNATGRTVLTKEDTNSYLNKEVALNLKMNRGQEQVYVVKVTTNRGSSVKKVMSSK
ncbi:T9SS type A sorting domain-containing protein, partial [Flavobacterium xinjiangense]